MSSKDKKGGSAKSAKRRKVVEQAPVPSEMDKKKMAAFFTAGTAKDETTVQEEIPAKEETPAVEASSAVSSSESLASEGAATVAVEPAVEAESAAVPEAEPVSGASEAGPAEGDAGNDNQGNDDNGNNQGDDGMTVKDGNGGGSFTMLPMFVVLVVVAIFWLYYISAAPGQREALVQIERSQAEVSTLTERVRSLEDEISRLRSKMVQMKEKAAASQAVAVSPGKEPGKDPALVKDPSFSRAPVPFWHKPRPGCRFRGPAKKNAGGAKLSPAPARDSFSRAPVPFWRKGRGSCGKKGFGKAVAAPVPAANQKPRLAGQPGTDPAADPSFSRAPVPFWRK